MLVDVPATILGASCSSVIVEDGDGLYHHVFPMAVMIPSRTRTPEDTDCHRRNLLKIRVYPCYPSNL